MRAFVFSLLHALMQTAFLWGYIQRQRKDRAGK
jgi:hypothetical protein